MTAGSIVIVNHISEENPNFSGILVAYYINNKHYNVTVCKYVTGKSYRHRLEHEKVCGVQFLGFAVYRNRDGYEAQVLREQDDQHCGPT